MATACRVCGRFLISDLTAHAFAVRGVVLGMHISGVQGLPVSLAAFCEKVHFRTDLDAIGQADIRSCRRYARNEKPK